MSMDEATYRADPRPSITQLGRLDSAPSPAHALASMQAGPTAAQALGTAVHCAILEPQRFTAAYVAAPQGIDRRTKAGKEEWAAFERQAEGKTVLTRDEHETVCLIYDRWAKHRCNALLRLCDLIEQPLCGMIGGVECKGRPDAVSTHPAGAMVVEVKTTSSPATRAEFERSLANWNYGFQAAGYRMLCESLRMPVRHSVYIVCETKPPHAVAVYRLRDEVVDWYRPKVHAAAMRWHALATLDPSSWPALPEEIVDIGLPRWHDGAREL